MDIYTIKEWDEEGIEEITLFSGNKADAEKFLLKEKETFDFDVLAFEEAFSIHKNEEKIYVDFIPVLP